MHMHNKLGGGLGVSYDISAQRGLHRAGNTTILPIRFVNSPGNVVQSDLVPFSNGCSTTYFLNVRPDAFLDGRTSALV